MAGRIGNDGVIPTSTNPLLNALIIGENVNAGVSVVVEHPLSTNINHLVRDWDVSLDTTGVVKAAILIAMHKIPDLPLLREGNHDAPIIFITTAATVGGAVEVVGSSNDIANIERNSNGSFLRQVINSVPPARTWIVDLAAAHQVRPLTPKNIEGYFMSKNATKVIGRDLLDIISIVSSVLPRIVGDEAGLSVLRQANSDWIKYHTTATSTGFLVQKCIQSLSPAFPNMFSPATVALVEAAVNRPYDKTASDVIPRIAVALTYVWLREAKQLPENWYQGEKAYQNTNPAILRRFSTVCKKYLALSADDTAVEATTDLGTLAGYVATAPGLANI